MGLLFDTNKSGLEPAKWKENLTANAKVAAFMGSIPASSDRVESEAAYAAVLYKAHKEHQKIHLKVSTAWK